MISSCPACGKPNPVLPFCQRCGCELALLEKLLSAAKFFCATAKFCLANGDRKRALELAEQSWHILHTTEAAQVAFIAAATMHDTRRTLAWYARVLH